MFFSVTQTNEVYMPEIVIIHPGNKDHFCKNCGSKTVDDMEYPKCNMKFWGECFQAALDGDGSKIKCPNIDCNTTLAFPHVGA